MARGSFPDTSWSLVERAALDGSDGEDARRELAARYYAPVQAFARFVVKDEQVAADIAHDVISRKLLSGYLAARARKEIGRFRNLLMTTIHNAVRDHWRDELMRPLPPEAEESLFGRAEEEFHRAWREQMVRSGIETVRSACNAENQKLNFELLHGYCFSPPGIEPTWKELGEPHGLNAVQAHGRALVAMRKLELFLHGAGIQEL